MQLLFSLQWSTIILGLVLVHSSRIHNITFYLVTLLALHMLLNLTRVDVQFIQGYQITIFYSSFQDFLSFWSTMYWNITAQYLSRIINQNKYHFNLKNVIAIIAGQNPCISMILLSNIDCGNIKVSLGWFEVHTKCAKTNLMHLDQM